MTRAETIGWIVATWLVLLNPATPAVVMAEEATPETRVHFNIPRQPADLALTQFAEQANLTLLFPTDGVQERTANELVGEYTLDEAIDILLAGTGLAPTFKNRLVLDIAIEDESTVMGEAMDIKKKAGLFGILAGVFAGNVNAQDSSQEPEREKLPIEEIVVTGTNIRGVAPESSPVRVFDREDIQISGAATAHEFIQTLPQNFGGGSNITQLRAGLPNDDNTRFNSALRGGAGGASVNLHGLGSGATLVLLNGHRVAPSSGIGDFVDISMIPASALERVEVLSDGASSIYGGDAVAGVVNFILRDDFDGLETSLRYGTGTEHGTPGQHRINVTAGNIWDTGNALVVYEHFSQDDLSAGDRSFSQNAPLPTDLLPDQTRHSALASVSQEVTPDLELFADFTYSVRKTALDATPSLVDSTTRYTSKSDGWNISAGGSWAIHNDWILDTFGTYSSTQTKTNWESATAFAPRAVDSTLWTVDAKASGTILELSGGELKVAFGGHYRSEAFSNVSETASSVVEGGIERQSDRDVSALFGEANMPIVGPDNAMPGIARLEINASGRFTDYSDFGSAATPKVGVLWSPFEGLNLRGSYSTSFNPPPLGRVGAIDRSITAYPSLLINTVFGFTPSDPSIADVDIISVNGTSNDLEAEQSRAFTFGIDLDRQWGNHGLSAHATYFDTKFEGRLGTTPIPDGSFFYNATNIAFDHPELFPEGTVVFFPSIDLINDVLNSAELPDFNFGADPLNASVILFANVVRNLSLTFVRGTDFDVTYTLESESKRGTLVLGLAGTYFIDFEQQAAVTTPIVEQLNTLFSPVDLNLRGHAGYTDNGFMANLFLNYKTDYRVDNTPGAMRLESWTTVDLSLAYDTRQSFGDSVFRDTVFRLSISNLLDNDPPLVPSDISYSGYGYDPTNASPLGRFIAFELTKRF